MKSEQSQWQDLRDGCPDACAELVRANYQAVYRFLVHLTRDSHRAEDLTQEVFATAWQRIASFNGRAAPSTWLYRIAYNKFIDAARSQQRATAALERCTSRGESPDPPDPLDIAMAGDEVRHLYEALDELDAADRAPLVLHYLQGLSYREMALVLDEPVGTIKWRTSEALGRLRMLLNEEVKGDVQQKIH